MTGRASTALPRTEFPVGDEWVYMDHAGVAPLPRRAAAAVREYLDDATTRGSVGVEKRLARVEEIRGRAAGFLGVDVGEVAFVKNTTEGISFVANGLDWRPGDRVVVPGREFPSTFFPWISLRDRGVE